MYRSYHEKVHQWKMNSQPNKFVKYCLDKLQLAHDIPLENIVKESGTSFKVVNSDEKSNYKVSFENSSNLPSCSCYSWKKEQVLCKHFIAVMEKFSLTWDDFGEKYRNSPFLNIDYDVFTNDVSNTMKIQKERKDDDVPDEVQEFSELPKPRYPKMATDSKCRELLKQIRISPTQSTMKKKCSF